MLKSDVFPITGLRKAAGHIVRTANATPGRLRFPKQGTVINRVLTDGRTYLEPAALFDLVALVSKAEEAKTEGILIEAGCALGGSAIVITSAKRQQRPFRVYDTFGLIPPPSGRDGEDVVERYEEISSGKAVGIDGDTYYGYKQDLYSDVSESFRRHGYPIEDNSVELIQGLFEDTLLGSEPVAFAHIDCDWYDSVMVSLTRLVPRLVPGGTLVLDDYDHWSGCRQAVDAFFSHDRDAFKFTHRRRLHVTKR